MLLLPVPGSALQARYSGPYTIKEKVNDRNYIVSTLDQKRRNRLYHTNMLKPYLNRGVSLLPSIVEDKNVLKLKSLTRLGGLICRPASISAIRGLILTCQILKMVMSCVCPVLWSRGDYKTQKCCPSLMNVFRI